MARPLITVEGRTQPIGDRKFGRTGVPGLIFTRIPRIHRARAFSSAPRLTVDLITPQEDFEENYLLWQAKFGGTRPEYIVYNYLEKHERLRPDIDFIFQSSRFGGRQVTGGSVVDFELPFLRLMFRVQGERFHLASPDIIASDILQKQSLKRLGFTVVDIYAEMLIAATYQVMTAALRGVTLRNPII